MENVLTAIADYNKNAKVRLSPCLIGCTGVGKTTRIREWAEKRELPVQTLLLGSMLPEEILGLPKVVRGETTWSIPEWAPIKEPAVILLDELDKAPEECMATILTLIAENRVRNHLLHPDTIIIAAMQPVLASMLIGNETGRALSARLCFLPLDYNWKTVAKRVGVSSLDFLPSNNSIELPILPHPSPRQIEWCSGILRSLTKDSIKKQIISGVLPSQFHEPFMAALEETYSLSPEAAVKALVKKPSRLDKLELPEISNLLPDIFCQGTPKLFATSVKRLALEGTPELLRSAMENAFNVTVERTKANGNELDIMGNHTKEEMKEILDETYRDIAKAYIARGKAEKKD